MYLKNERERIFNLTKQKKEKRLLSKIEEN